MAEALKREAATVPPPTAERITSTGVPLQVIEGGHGNNAAINESGKEAETPPSTEKPVSAAEGRLASAFRSAGETAVRWGRKALIAVDGHRVSVATKSLEGLQAEMATARNKRDAVGEAKFAGQIASQLGEIQRLSQRRQANATEVKKYHEAKLAFPNKNIANGEKLLNGEVIDGKRKLGLNDEIKASQAYIEAWTERKDALSAEFAKLLDSSQLDSESAKKAQLISEELKGIADDIAHEQGNLDAKQKFAKSVADRITANKTAYATQYAKLDKYSAISQDGRSGTEAASLKKRQEVVAAVRRNPTESPPVKKVEDAIPRAVEASAARGTEETPNTGVEFTPEELQAGLRALGIELLNDEVRAALEKIVTEVGGRNMSETKVSAKDFAGFWNQARSKVDELPELTLEHIKKLGDTPKSLAEFGAELFLREDVKVSREALEKGIRGSAEKWVRLTKENKAA